LRFSSGRDFQRALERAVRLAGVPMAYSSGFHPHPRISYANAAPTGVASEAEYVELALAARVDPDELARSVDAALPVGLDIVEAVEAGPGSLAERLEASHWRLAFRDGCAGASPGSTIDALGAAIEAFLAAERIEVTRVTKSGPKTFDARGPVLRAEFTEFTESTQGPDAAGGGPGKLCAILETVVRHTTPVVRPDDFLSALRSIAGLELSSPPLVTRLAQGPLSGEPPRVADPLAADRNVIGTCDR
jgi:radical SAM-linked protein